jgi:hypothetical protein
MAELDDVIRVYHVIHPTAEHLTGLKAPRWPHAYNLAATFPDPGLAPEEALELAFRCTQQDHPLINTVSWQPGARRRSTSPGDVVVLRTGEAYLCDFSGWKPLDPPPLGFWTRLVTSLHRPGPHSMTR